MQLHILNKVEPQVAEQNGKVVYVGASMFVGEYTVPGGTVLALQKVLIGSTGEVEIITILNDPYCGIMDMERMIKLIDTRDESKAAGRGFNVSKYSESDLIEMEFIDNTIKFNAVMVQMALDEVNGNQLTTAEAVREVVAEIQHQEDLVKGKGVDVNQHTGTSLIEMEFVGGGVEYNAEMVQMAIDEINNGMTTAEAVQEVICEMNNRKKREKAL